MFITIVVLLIVSILVGVSLFKTGVKENFNLLYLSGPTKCFSCEKDMIMRHGHSGYAWMGKPSKCFDCEQQFARVTPNLANMSHGTKCFACEEQTKCGI